METLGEWNDIYRAVLAPVNFSSSFQRRSLYMHGLLIPQIPDPQGDVDFSGMHEVANQLEAAVKTTQGKVLAVQSPAKRNPRHPLCLYEGLITASSERGCEAKIFLLGANPEPGEKSQPGEEPRLSFQIYFSLDDYAERSRQAVTEMWPYVYGIKDTVMTGGYGKGQVMISKKGNPVQWGVECFQSLGWELAERDFVK
jgi:hypothetical protein